MSAAVYSYPERTILDGHYENNKKVYRYDSALRELHQDRREKLIASGHIHIRDVLKMTDDDHIIADRNIDEGDWSMDIPDENLPAFEQEPGYMAVAELLWGV